MFTPEINFLKERPQTPGTDNVVFVDESAGGGGALGGAGAIAVGFLAAVIALGAWAGTNLYLGGRRDALLVTNNQLSEDLRVAQAELSELEALDNELQGILARTEAFRTFFSQVQPWSAILQDLRDRIPPDVWITNITASGRQLSIRGGSLSFEQVNDLILTLLESRFVSDVRLISGQKVDGSSTTLESVNYEVQVSLRDLDLGDPELQEVLLDKNAVGLAEKLNILRNLEVN